MNKFKGYWFTSTTGTHEIALARPGSDFINIYCDDCARAGRYSDSSSALSACGADRNART